MTAKSNAREGDGVGDPMFDMRPVNTEHPLFEPIWQAIKQWDIQRIPGAGCAGATGTDVQIVIDAISAMQAQQGAEPVAWQPIESAPKDGTPILGCVAHPNMYAPRMIVWADYHPNSKGKETWRDSATCGNKQEYVTHWQPLPAAPATGAPR